MQEQHLFEYAVIRVVPKVEREEFLNVGVVLYCARKKFLQALVCASDERMCSFATHTDIGEVREYLASFVRICAGTADAGPIGKLGPAERFRWLTATRSTVVQSSKVHPGLCAAPQTMLQTLYEQMVV